jgi:hypothetical protein
MYSCLLILITIPVTTATDERSISIMRRVETYVRSPMPIERLSSLAVLHCYKQREIDIEKVIHSFVVKKERCLVFLLTTRDDIEDQN